MLERDLLEHLSTGVIGLDADLRILYLSPATEALLEVSAARLGGQHAQQLLGMPDSWLQTLEQARSERHPIVCRGLLLHLHNGSEARFDLIITPLADRPRNALSLVAELHPVDRLMRISEEESQQNAQETTRSVVRGLAHEIKNPLGGVRGAAQLLARELPTGGTLAEYTEVIIKEADRLRDLVDRMLGPNTQPSLEPLNVHEVLEHVGQLISAEAGPRLRLKRDYDPSLPTIRGDRAQLIQAVLNIMRNAMEATLDQPDARLCLVTRAQRQFTIAGVRHRLVCHIDIIDNGPGVPRALQHALFVPMISGRANGCGLGLSISQSIVNRHGGLISCDSEPGRTCFSIYLPLDKPYA